MLPILFCVCLQPDVIKDFGRVTEGSRCVRTGGIDSNFRGWHSVVCMGSKATYATNEEVKSNYMTTRCQK